MGESTSSSIQAVVELFSSSTVGSHVNPAAHEAGWPKIAEYGLNSSSPPAYGWMAIEVDEAESQHDGESPLLDSETVSVAPDAALVTAIISSSNCLPIIACCVTIVTRTPCFARAVRNRSEWPTTLEPPACRRESVKKDEPRSPMGTASVAVAVHGQRRVRSEKRQQVGDIEGSAGTGTELKSRSESLLLTDAIWDPGRRSLFEPSVEQDR